MLTIFWCGFSTPANVMSDARENLFYISVLGLLSTKLIMVIDGLALGNSFWIGGLTLLVLGLYFSASAAVLWRFTEPKQETSETQEGRVAWQRPH